MRIREAGIKYLKQLARPLVRRAQQHFRQINTPDSKTLISPFQATKVALTKKAEDIALFSLALPAALSLALIIGGIVKLTMGSPVLFRQIRVGQGEREFEMLKFRSMENDKVTTVGKILRASSLDELPQLLNVFKGEMSVVGPRPHRPEIIKTSPYSNMSNLRHIPKPGMIPCDIFVGRKEGALDDIIAVDFYYVANWSLWLDLKIILFAVPSVALGWGAG